MSKKDNGFIKFIAGVSIGAGLGILFAPKEGKETRKDLKNKMNDLMDSVKNIDLEEVKTTVENKVAEIKEDLKNLDKETVIENIKKQAKAIKSKAEDLVKYAKENGTPVILDAATKVKDSTIKTLEAITSKLKDEPKKTKETKKTKKASK